MSIKYAIKELVVRRHRTFVTCIGIAVAVAFVTVLYTITTAYKAQIRKPFEASGIDLVLQKPKEKTGDNTKSKGVILPESATAIAGDEVKMLAGIDGIENMVTSVQAWSFDRGNFKVIMGIDPESPAIGPAMFMDWVNNGRFFGVGEEGVAVIEKHYAKFNGVKIGDDIEIAKEKFSIIGTVEVKEGNQTSAPNLFIPLSDIRRLTGIKADDVNAIYLRLNKATDAKIVMDKINKAIPGIKISTPDSSLSVADSLFSLSERFIWLLSFVIAIVAVFLILKTVSASISERVREIGVMKAVGWSSGNIRRQFSLEMLIQSIIGGAGGIFIGVSLSFALSMVEINAPLPWQGSPIPGSHGGATELVPLDISISPCFLLIVFIITVLISWFCGFIASKKASDMNPAQALRSL